MDGDADGFVDCHVLEMQIVWAVFSCLANQRVGKLSLIEAAAIVAFVAILAIELAVRFFAPPPANKQLAVAYS